MERRLRPRKPVALGVYLNRPGKQPRRYLARNLSSSGVFLDADAIEFPRHVPLQLFFALTGSGSNVIRVHRVSAMVVRSTRGGVGMMFCGSLRPTRSQADQGDWSRAGT